MKYLSIILMLYPLSAEPKTVDWQWWWNDVFGRCTKTDIEEEGSCVNIEVKRPNA